MEMYLTSEDQAVLYNKFRPSPPLELVEKIISFLKEYVCILDTAVDIGCGSGQSTSVLAPYFKNVVGVDNCYQQLNEAKKNCTLNNVSYKVGSSDFLDFPDSSVHLVTAGQCAHFFEMPKFYEEVDRILQTNGVLAIYGYCLPVPFYGNISLEHNVRHMFENTINNYVSKESKLVYIKNYRTKDFEKFPFSDQETIREEFNKTIIDASLEDLLGYCQSWSGFQRFKNLRGETDAVNLINDFKDEILKTINKKEATPNDIKLSITFKYFLLLGRKVQVTKRT